VTSRRITIPHVLAILSIWTWAVSLFLPAADVGFFVASGWHVLVEGWRGILDFDIFGLSWLTNPLLLTAWLSFFFFRTPWAAVLALAALATAVTSFLFVTFSEHAEMFEGFGPGFYLWLVAVLLQAAAAAAVTFKLRETPNP
jgi:hypothetical protein